MKYLKKYNESVSGHRCPICGSEMYRTDVGGHLVTLQCASPEAMFWAFPRGTKENIKSHNHFERSIIHIPVEEWNEIEEIQEARKRKKKKTTLNILSKGEYSWNPTYNSSSPASTSNVKIGQIKINESEERDILYDIDIISALINDLEEDMGFSVRYSINVSKSNNRGNSFRSWVNDFNIQSAEEYIQNGIDKNDITAIQYQIVIQKNGNHKDHVNLKERLEQFSKMIEELTHCRINRMSINVDSRYLKEFRGGRHVDTEICEIRGGIDILNLVGRRTGIVKPRNPGKSPSPII